ncbi:hypothetical protein GCM10011487_68900 [Steroidobacter agaridevorans]|uniref:Uncharacterized protein n=1 Tax=Steroidobacter agaridevorans TaxID=2695856 RepID=A0A829YNQ8_9GAMM|nr:hypothetical protein [Steroidobacter agaridevorans]GFE84890.1 hypothetical protein GCM10011487_68900 [Steroidobacter agaridevorans]
MIKTIEIDLTNRGLTFPSSGVGMVLAQPFLQLTEEEPFTCSPASKQAQLAAIARTLQIARACPHGAEKTHFTIFPECTIPGLDGIAAIDQQLAEPEWPGGTLVIGGVDGLTQQEFTQLSATPGTNGDNAVDNVRPHEWVNCCIIWIKFDDGSVQRWIQPKLVPAWVEIDVNHQAMFRGKSVFVFKARFDNQTFARFCALVCFDWIGTVDNQRPWKWVADDLGKQAAEIQAQISLTWLFVVQYNPKPSHASFLSQIESFFDQTAHPNVLRHNACLVMANAAGHDRPGRANQFGSSSILHSAQAQFAEPGCQPTYCNGGQRQRASGQLGKIKDALFRERGACIHSFLHRNPASIVPGPSGKTLALDRPFVYAFDNVNDPRAPGSIVPASIKWINDHLDAAVSLATKHPMALLIEAAATAHTDSITQLRSISAQAIETAVGLACPSKNLRIPDDWDLQESNSLDHMLHTMTILAAGRVDPIIHGRSTHASITLGAKQFEVIAVRGDSHEVCANHISRNPPNSRRATLVISRDDDTTEWPLRFQSILNTPLAHANGQDEPKVTDPNSAIRYVGYRTILDAFRIAETQDQLMDSLNAIIAD